MEITPPAEAPARMLGLPAWSWALGGLLVGLLTTSSLVLLEHHDLSNQARARHVLIARRTVTQIERQLASAGAQLRAVQSAYLVAPDIDQARFQAIVTNLQAQRMVPSLLAVAYAPRTADASGRTHYAYTLVAPLSSNRSLLGLDLSLIHI